MDDRNEQEKFWAEEYSKNYIEKNNNFNRELLLKGWRDILNHTSQIDSVLSAEQISAGTFRPWKKYCLKLIKPQLRYPLMQPKSWKNVFQIKRQKTPAFLKVIILGKHMTLFSQWGY